MFALKILFLNFQGWLLFNYQCSCLLSLCDSLFIISHLQSLVNNFFIFLFQEFLSFFDSQNNLPYFYLSVNNFLKFFFVCYCRFNDKYDIPLGYAYNGMNTDDGHYLRQTLDTIIDNNKILHPKRSLKDHIPEGYKLLRKLLAEQEDHSVVFIALGPETNLARLLISEADEYSELDGKALVAQKVKLLSVMGGLYGNEFDFPEWNIINDLNAAQITFKEWPTPIIASGWELGNKIRYPHQSILNDFAGSYKHPLCVSYKIYQEMPYDRETWDLTSVLQAIEPGNNYFNLSEKGTITIDSIGQSIFSPSESGKHQYLTIQGEENIRATRNALIRQVTGKEN